MDNFAKLEAAWNKQIDIMRNNPYIRKWYEGFRNSNSFTTDKTPDNRTVICEVLSGKQLKVTIKALEIESLSEIDRIKYNAEHSASFTRNLPHDLKQLMKGTRV